MKEGNLSTDKQNFQIFLVETLQSQAGGRTSQLSQSGMCCSDFMITENSPLLLFLFFGRVLS